MYIYSTATADQKFNLFHKMEKGGVPRVAGHVVIQGGANVANKHLITPKGVATKITADQYKMLEQVSAYKSMVKNGFMCADDKKLEPEQGVKDLEVKDKSAPMTEKQVKDSGLKVTTEEVEV